MQGRVTGKGDSATQKLPDNQQRSLAEAVKFMRPGIRAVSRLRWKIKQGIISMKQINGCYSLCPAANNEAPITDV